MSSRKNRRINSKQDRPSKRGGQGRPLYEVLREEAHARVTARGYDKTRDVGAYMNAVELVLHEISRELCQEVLREEIEEAGEEEEPQPHYTCPGCGQRTRRVRRSERDVLTSHGEVQLQRWYYHCARCRWEKPGATAVLHLCCVKLSQQWRNFWKTQRTRQPIAA